MGKDKSTEDTISESEYTFRMLSNSAQPEDDSPGDSETDAGAEFSLGLEFKPQKKADSGVRIADKPKYSPREIPETAKVVSSEQPEPWKDA